MTERTKHQTMGAADGENTNRVTLEYDELSETDMSSADAGIFGHHNAT